MNDSEKEKPVSTGLVGELWAFLRVRKKWWLAPIIVALLLLGVLVITAQSSAVSPFVYVLF